MTFLSSNKIISMIENDIKNIKLKKINYKLSKEDKKKKKINTANNNNNNNNNNNKSSNNNIYCFFSKMNNSKTIINTEATTSNTTTKAETTNIINDVDNNINNEIIKSKNNWENYTNRMIDEGFTKSCILDLNTGDCDSGFYIGYQEWREIYDIFNGNHLISLSCALNRFFIVYSNDVSIIGSDSSNLTLMVRKTTNKAIIGIFETKKIPGDKAYEIMGEIYLQIIENDSNEKYTNLIDSSNFKN